RFWSAALPAVLGQLRSAAPGWPFLLRALGRMAGGALAILLVFLAGVNTVTGRMSNLTGTPVVIVAGCGTVYFAWNIWQSMRGASRAWAAISAPTAAALLRAV